MPVGRPRNKKDTRKQIVAPPLVPTPADDGTEQKAKPKPPEPPEDFSEPAKAMWRELALIVGDVSTLDVRAFRALCFSVVRYEKTRLDSEDWPYCIEDKGGVEKVYPGWNILKQAEDEMRMWMSQFHMTPAARRKSGLSPAVKTDNAWTKEFDK